MAKQEQKGLDHNPDHMPKSIVVKSDESKKEGEVNNEVNK